MVHGAPGNTAYTTPVTFRLHGTLDAPLFEDALTGLVARHEALRMRFPTKQNGQPSVTVDKPGRVELKTAEASTVEQAVELVEEELARPFDLAADAMLRAMLIRLGPDDHVFLLAVHHIVSDGQSLEILVEELFASYAGFLEGTPTVLPEPTVQFGDFAVWEQGRLAGPIVSSDAAFWREQLAGVPDLNLPTDHPRPAEQRFNGAVHTFAWDAELAEAVRELGRAHGATLYMTLLAAYQAVLARHSGQGDFAVGSPVAGRPFRELAGVVGCFVNMMVLRSRVENDPTVAQHVQRTRETVLGALAHQDYSFSQIVKDAQVERDPSRSAIFQATFTLTDQSVPDRTVAGLDLSSFTPPITSSQFDLALYMTETSGELGGAFTYRTDLFDAATVERIERSMRLFLLEAVTGHDRRLSELSLLDEEERASLLGEWAGTRTWRTSHRTLGEMAEAQAARTPDGLALVAGERSVTFAELHRRANRLARNLRDSGVGPGTRVAICLDETVNAAVAILAVLKAGGAYLPLDPEQPRVRSEFLLADSSAALLITDSALRDQAAGFTGPVIEVDRLATDGDDSPLDPLAGPGDLAYVIYTSGTTGQPKGVGVEHRQIVAYLEYIREEYDIAPGAAFGLLESLAFDISMLMFYLPLTGGGTLYQLPRRSCRTRTGRGGAGTGLSEDDAFPPCGAEYGGPA